MKIIIDSVYKHRLLLGIILLAFFLSLYRLTDIPFAVHGDEGETADFARSLLHKPPNLVGVGWYDLPIASFFPHSFMMKIFGETVVANRLGSVIFGILILPFFYALTVLFFKKRVALLATYFLAISHIWIAFSRVGITYIQATFFVVVTFYFFIKGLHTRTRKYFLISGIFLGLCFYSYYAARIALIILGIYVLTFFIFKQNKILFFKQMLVMFLGFFIIFLPQVLFYTQNPSTFLSRTKEVFVFSKSSQQWMQHEYQGKTTFAVLMTQFTKALNVGKGDGSWQYGYKGQLLDQLTILLILSGFFYLFLHFNFSAFFVFLWFGCVLFFGQILTSIPSPIFLPRFVVGIPTLAIFTALGVEFYIKYLSRKTKWVFVSLICLILLFVNLKIYFVEYPKQHLLSIAGDFNAVASTKIGYALKQIPKDYQVILFTEPNLYNDFGTIRFLAPERIIKSFNYIDQNIFKTQLPFLPKEKVVYFFYKGGAQSFNELKLTFPYGREENILGPQGDIQIYTYTLD